MPLPPDAITRRGAITVVDLSGFTATILRDGVEPALERIWTARRLLLPLLSGSGEVYKVDADNLYAFHASADDAVAAALACHDAVREVEGVDVGIGIGFGDLLYLPSEDEYYGPEFNLASKLGEDTAEPGQTLLTEAAAAAVVNPKGTPGARFPVIVSGIEVHCCEWLARPSNAAD